MVLGRVVTEAARRFGDAPAIVDADGTAVSFRDLDRLSDAVASALEGYGIGPGHRVVLRLPSRPRYLIAYAAIAKAGAATAGINPRLAEPEQAALVDLADASLVLDDEREVDDLARAGAGDAAPALPADPERPVAMVFTSGTTGTPKAAVFGERQLEAIWRIDVGGAWADDPGVRGAGAPVRHGAPMLASTQFAHIGITTKLPWYLATGARLHLLERWRARDALEVIARERMGSIGGIAPQIALMLREPDFDAFDVSCVQTIVMGGAASPPALVDEARRRFGAAYSIRYSSTESGGCGTGTAFDADDEEALFTVGRPRPGIEVAIHDPDRRVPVPDGEIGEVWLRSPTTMSGYWRDTEATAAALTADGWLRTGDLGYLDDRGLLRLAGRSKEMYIRGGYNVYPMEVEAQLASHPLVGSCAIVPRADEVMGEIGVAVVVPRDADVAPTLDDVREHLRPRLASYKLPEAIRIVDALPYTPMHKVDRRALAQAETS